jgi:DNA-binding NarL/FixJ family response regulator
MLVDDHAMVRRGLRSLIESMPGWIVCAEAGDGHEAVAIGVDAAPDIIVIDLSMPRLGGLDATIQLRQLIPDVEILILTMHESDQLVEQAAKAGAIGYLRKGDSDERLMEALTTIARHQPYNYLGSTGVTSDPERGESDDRRLTRRERQIVKLVAEGNTNQAIAELLGISIKTVETHRLAAMRKVGARSSADLTMYAARNGLVNL